MLSHVQLFATALTAACQASLSWDSPGKNTGVGSHFLLQRIFPIQGLNPPLPRLLHWQADSSSLHNREAPSREYLEDFLLPANTASSPNGKEGRRESDGERA